MTRINKEQAARGANDEHEGEPPITATMGNIKAEESQSANLTIKVNKRQRLHWLIEAKKQGTSLTAAITDALNKRFGTPE